MRRLSAAASDRCRAPLRLVCAALLGGAPLACSPAGEFECSTDLQCTRSGGVLGACEPAGFCSFPDPSCPTGRRYGELSSEALAEQCVAPAVPDAGAGPSTPDDTGGSDASDASDAEAPESGDETTWGVGAATGELVTSGTAADVVSTDEGSSSSSSFETTGQGESSTGDEDGCAFEVIDDFEDGLLDAEWNVNEGWSGANTHEADGALQITIVGTTSSNTIVSRALDVSLASGWVRLRVDEFSAPSSAAASGVVFAVGGCAIQLYVQHEGVMIYRWLEGAAGLSEWYAFSGGAPPQYLRIALSADETVLFETSDDGTVWDFVAAHDFPECGTLDAPATIGMIAGGSASSITRRFDEIAVCVAP